LNYFQLVQDSLTCLGKLIRRSSRPPWGASLAIALLSLAFPLHGFTDDDLPDLNNPVEGSISIESVIQSADNSTGVFTAVGSVQVVYPSKKITAKAQQVQFFSNENRLVLSGDVDFLREGGHPLQSERVIYLLDEDQVFAEDAQLSLFFKKAFKQPIQAK